MAKTIANFLVGVGLDTKDFDKGSRQVDTSLSGFRSKAGLAGSAIAAAFSAAGLAAIHAGNKADKFALSVAKFDTSRRFIYNLGNAFRLMGGDASEAVDAISNAESILDKLKKGDASALEAAGLAQVNVSSLQTAQDGEELLRRLSSMMPDLEKWQQRSLQQTFGLSDAAMRTLQNGTQRFDELIAQADKYADNLDKAAEAGRAYNIELAKLGIQFDEIGQILAIKILPQFSSLLGGFSSFLDKNMPKVSAAADYIAENVGGVTAIGAGLTAATVGGATAGIGSKLGIGALSTLGRGVALGGGAGVAAGGASLLYDLKASDIESMTGLKNVGKYYRAPSETVSAIGKWWRGGTVSPADAAASSPSAMASKPTLSQMARSDASIPPPIVIDNRVTLNGREMAKFVNEVNSEQRFEAVTDMTSTVNR